MRALLLTVALMAAGCAGLSAPSPTPGSIVDDVVAGLVRRGVTVHRLVSGDPGCASPGLQGNALRMEVSVLNQSATRDLFVFGWRRQAQFDEAKPDFDACVAAYEAGRPGVTAWTVELSPWRAYGSLGNDQLLRMVEESLREAGGQGP